MPHCIILHPDNNFRLSTPRVFVPMASPDQVKQYLAYWFQLGKRVLLHGGREVISPQPIITGDRYSPEFEACWQRVTDSTSGDCYLEGTHQTIGELLSSAWEIQPCARCEMPVPMPDLGVMGLGCPCEDLPFWPDLETPKPRSPVSSAHQLGQIRDRLVQSTRPERSPGSQTAEASNGRQRHEEQKLAEGHHHDDAASMQAMRNRLRAFHTPSQEDQPS